MLDALLNQIARPVLVIVVYDPVPGRSAFSRPHPRKLANAVQDQPTLWSVGKRVTSLLVPQGDRVAHITGRKLFRRVKEGDAERCYVMVSGDNFSFGERLERDFFEPDGESVRLKFGSIDGPIVAEMIAEFQASLR